MSLKRGEGEECVCCDLQVDWMYAEVSGGWRGEGGWGGGGRTGGREGVREEVLR